VAAVAMTGGGLGVLVVVLVGLEGRLASAFRQVQASLLPWLARTPDELTSANTAASVLQSAAMVGGPAIAAALLAVGTAQSAMLVACGLAAVLGVGGLLVGPLAVDQRTAAGDLRTRRRDHQGRRARPALLHHRSGPGARRQGRVVSTRLQAG
jgi:hypothetical protein